MHIRTEIFQILSVVQRPHPRPQPRHHILAPVPSPSPSLSLNDSCNRCAVDAVVPSVAFVCALARCASVRPCLVVPAFDAMSSPAPPCLAFPCSQAMFLLSAA